jgi:hypothetical protein
VITFRGRAAPPPRSSVRGFVSWCLLVVRAGWGFIVKRLLIVLGLGGVFFLLVPRNVVAAPILPCPRPAELLFLQPLDAFLDGGRLSRDSRTGRFTTDAGLDFDVPTLEITPLAGPTVDGCQLLSRSVRVDLVDPFTGASHLLTLEQAP